MQRVLMLPGFGGGADQSILVHLEEALRRRGLSALRASLTGGRPSVALEDEVQQARALRRSDPDISAYAGRSFGGRVLARLALDESPRALLLLGFPVRSAAGRRRPDDERALTALSCPTLIVQGSRDPLGPIRTLERLVASNPRLELVVLRGAGHSFGRQEKTALETAADWLARRLS
jgi:predicted alpha/beta-hydrolase family hydrolase